MKGKEKKNKIKLPAYNNIPTSLTLNTAQHIPNSQVSPIKRYIPTSLSHPLLFFFITLLFSFLPYNNISNTTTLSRQVARTRKSFDTLITSFKETNMEGGHMGWFLFCCCFSLLFFHSSGSPRRNLPIIAFEDGYTPLFGDHNLAIHRDGKSVHLSLDERESNVDI